LKSIILFRHAKSDWGAAYDSDHERPLNGRGRKAATLMGRYLAALDQLPDRVISSTARRAHDTVQRAGSAGNWQRPVELTAELYEASPDAVLGLIRRQDDAASSLLLAGHEPTWSLVVGLLVGGGSVRMPTAAMARIDFEAECWREVAPGGGALIWHVTPRMLGRLGFEDAAR